jgi:protein-S-isoprenylcysteine O-methyltransferase Ste14
MTILEKIVVYSWLAFIVFWAVSATFVKKTVERQGLLHRLQYAIPLFIGVLLLFKGYTHSSYPWGLGTVFIPSTLPVVGVGVVILLFGLFMTIWARVYIGTNWNGGVVLKEKHTLIVNGPYNLVRHPIYTGLIMMFFGSALTLGTVEAFLGVLLVVLSCLIKLSQEEDLMKRQFPSEYHTYKMHVKKLIPFVW